jgi:hydroxymethylglutaryl-CoA lyase
MIQLFDVTMRDGLQDLPIVYTIDQKKILLDSIIKDNIHDYEIGSYASLQRVPQMKDSTELYHYATEKYKNKNFYMLIFNQYGLQEVVNNNIKNICFITSYCDSFLKKNINRSMDETLLFIKKSLFYKSHTSSKVYISTFCGSPFTPFSFEKLKTIIDFCFLQNITHITLCDTYGLLTPDLFENILIVLQSENYDFSRFSLHLHKNIYTLQNIELAIQYHITKFDISHLEAGGCIILEKDKNTLHNLHYNDIQKYLS